MWGCFHQVMSSETDSASSRQLSNRELAHSRSGLDSDSITTWTTRWVSVAITSKSRSPILTSLGGCEHTNLTQEETEDADYSVVITGVRRTPSRTTPPHEIHTALPVTHGGSNRLVTVECVFFCVIFCVIFCEMEGVALAIPLSYNVVIDNAH
ncbi:hypothetical protein SAMN05421858_4882 [Haladaptatus litoreus]|uniref:Uncharacterized protein n=1 Tax=Haladaptatus litoreus TaxID=553468 RepID=A0A1N7FAN9_9EURY|nr:hypothetical protein SAMN05421858_4882 [Haladaptatus litoreus]